MGLTPNVVDGNVILASWGNEVRDRARMVFASKAELDAQWPAAPNGSEAVALDTGLWWHRIGGAWTVAGPPMAWHADYPNDIGVTGAYGYYGVVAFTLPAPMSVVLTVEGDVGTQGAGGNVNLAPFIGAPNTWVGGLSVASPGVAGGWRVPFALSSLVVNLAAGPHSGGVSAAGVGTNPFVGALRGRIHTVAVGHYVSAATATARPAPPPNPYPDAFIYQPGPPEAVFYGDGDPRNVGEVRHVDPA